MKPLILAVTKAALRFRGILSAAFWVAMAILVAMTQRGEGSDTALIGTVGALAIPLAAFTLVTATMSGSSLAKCLEPWVRLGASRKHALRTLFLIPVTASAVLGALLGTAVVIITRSPTSPPWDAATTAWIAALAGAAYAAVFVAGSSFGKNGGGRGVALALDFILGASSGLGGVVTVRGHLRNLLGGAAPLEMGQRASSVWLVGFAIVAFALVLSRSRLPAARVTPSSDRGALA